MNKYVILYDIFDSNRSILLKYTKQITLTSDESFDILINFMEKPPNNFKNYRSHVFIKGKKGLLLENVSKISRKNYDIVLVEHEHYKNANFYLDFPGKSIYEKSYYFRANSDEDAKLIYEVGGYN